MVLIVEGGGDERLDLFVVRWDAFQRGGPLPLLLVDSEAPVVGASPWGHVARRAGDGWSRPAGAADDHLHLYGKGAHSFKLLATLDPAKLRAASPWAERFFATVDRLTGRDASRRPA